MRKIRKVIERRGIFEYLQKRNLLEQYKKSKMFLLAGHANKVHLKKLQPKVEEVWSFRINKQFRAIGIYDHKGNLRILRIDNHQ